MPAHYAVIHYAPNPIANERINIGVIAFDEHRIRCQFVNNWTRVKQFGAEDIGFLQEFADDLGQSAEDQLLLQLSGPGRLDADAIFRMAGSWVNSIQMSPPKGSLRDVDALLIEMSAIYLHERTSSGRVIRGRQEAAKIVVGHVERVVQHAVGEAAVRHLVKKDEHLMGKYKERQLDVAIRNGHLLAAAHGLSFELRDPRRLSTQLDSTARALDDVRTANLDLPLAVLALPPADQSDPGSAAWELYHQAQREFADIGALMVDEGTIDEWVESVLKTAPINPVTRLI